MTNLLPRNEEIILLTVLKLGGNAYGVSIRERIEEDSGELWSFASIYTPLDKLNQKGFVIKSRGEPSGERGGKSKFYYRVSPAGLRSLQALRDAQEKYWAGIPELIGEKKS
ncbi:MAG: PadR family transcriptional regulator [Candidatus Aminicenantes bacterium]|nr:PadR family transcriptional regulator [Candidatus Aminicenantes bacterium]